MTTLLVPQAEYLPDWHPKVQLREHALKRDREQFHRGLRRIDDRLHRRTGLPLRFRRQEFVGTDSDDDVISILRAIPVHRAAKTYMVFNSAAPTTAAPVKQPTGTAIRTMMQLAFATGFAGRLIGWGCSFDGSAAATPGQVEVFGTTVAATGLSTAYAAADIQPYSDPNAVANTAGTSGVPFNLGTSLSGFATGSVTEGSVATYRAADVEMLPPTQPYVYQWPLGREFEMPSAGILRVRMTFGTTINVYIWMVVEF